jgi:hypothetical protein
MRQVCDREGICVRQSCDVYWAQVLTGWSVDHDTPGAQHSAGEGHGYSCLGQVRVRCTSGVLCTVMGEMQPGTQAG